MSLLYKRIIEEIGDDHSELVERFVRELSGEACLSFTDGADGSVFQTFPYIYDAFGENVFSFLTKSQKEELERRIIEAIDDDIPDNQIFAMIDTFVGELED